MHETSEVTLQSINDIIGKTAYEVEQIAKRLVQTDVRLNGEKPCSPERDNGQKSPMSGGQIHKLSQDALLLLEQVLGLAARYTQIERTLFGSNYSQNRA